MGSARHRAVTFSAPFTLSEATLPRQQPAALPPPVAARYWHAPPPCACCKRPRRRVRLSPSSEAEISRGLTSHARTPEIQTVAGLSDASGTSRLRHAVLGRH